MKSVTYINAGAGSGKTTKLTKILAEKLEAEVKPSEVILTTFTELAASEFREKSRARLLENGLTAKAAELDSATIGTVHSVALNFIKKYWYLIGISPDMKVMSEDDLQVYISESLGDFVSQDDLEFFRKYRDYFDLKDSQSHTDLDFWKSYLLGIIDKVNNYDVDIDLSKKRSCQLVEQILNSNVALNKTLLGTFRDILAGQIGGFAKTNQNNFQPILDGLNTSSSSYANLVKLYKLLTNPKTAKKFINGFKETMTEVSYDAMLESIKDFQLSSLGDDSPGGMMKKMINTLFDIAQKWKDGFNKFKTNRHIIDYNDMERLFLELLDTKQVKDEIGGSYKLMMVDEFQDSSPIQLKIFDKLSELIAENKGQSYWVGDPKQSIYGFRGADVELVNEITKKFSDDERDKLPNSWRTREDLVNLTTECFTRAFEGIIDKDNVKLIAGREKSEESKKFSDPLYHWNCKAPNAGEFVNKVADRIKILLDSGIIIQEKDTKELRPIKAGDIAILCRINDECKAFAKALVSKGIPVCFVNDDILQQTEVQLVFTLLKFMVDSSNKSVRADLLRLLKDIPTEEILKERLDYRISIAPTIKDEKDETEKDLWLEDDELIKKLKAFKRTVSNLSVSDMLESIVYGLDLPELVAKWGDAENRRQNLQTLCALARKYDEHCLQMGIGASIGGLLTYLSYAEIENKIDNSANAVKVLTYHKSKGLEWYYVILSSLEDDSLEENKFTKKGFWGIHELRHPKPDENYGYYIQFLPAIVSAGNTNLPQPIINACVGLDIYKAFAEKERNELRHLLYVGVTRARDYLTTLSHQSSDTLPQLHWIRNTGISEGEITDNAAKLWLYDKLKPIYEDISGCPETVASTETKFTRYEYPDNPDISREPKYLSPSTLPKIEFAPENIEILKDLDCRIDPYKTDETNQAAAGTCIHNIFAVYDPALSHDENVEKATRIRNGNNMNGIIPDTGKVVTSIERLYAWLKETYGEATTVNHEVPFVQPLPGQVVHGEIDLLWMLNDKECVLIDFKNFPGKKSDITNPENRHYAGLYAAQLKAYREVLQSSGLTVKDTLIYYSVMGCVVRLNFPEE